MLSKWFRYTELHYYLTLKNFTLSCEFVAVGYIHRVLFTMAVNFIAPSSFHLVTWGLRHKGSRIHNLARFHCNFVNTNSAYKGRPCLLINQREGKPRGLIGRIHLRPIGKWATIDKTLFERTCRWTQESINHKAVAHTSSTKMADPKANKSMVIDHLFLQSRLLVSVVYLTNVPVSPSQEMRKLIYKKSCRVEILSPSLKEDSANSWLSPAWNG